MEVSSSRYYDKYRISNTHYLLMSAIEVYFGREIFKGDGTRIFYASDEYAFRQRIQKLYPSVDYDALTAAQLQFPFANYYRVSNWKIDTRPAIQNATAALLGFPISDSNGRLIRFLQAESSFSIKFYFNRDDDAQNCYDILMWAQNPSPKYLALPGLYYKNVKLHLPIILQISDVSWTNEYKENDWLKKNRILVVSATVNLKSFILDQYAQGEKSSLFTVLPAGQEIEEIYITRESILDFLSYKQDPLINEEFIEMDFLANFTPDPDLNFSLSSTGITETEATLVWDYNAEAESLYEPDVTILLNTKAEYTTQLSNKTFTLSNLSSGSTYTANIYIHHVGGTVTKYSITFQTTGSTDNVQRLEGLIGKKF